ncbi:MAG: adenosylmethionine--8-amino-7-oxononanoate transaminase [Cyclobacteriaceae bacterium]
MSNNYLARDRKNIWHPFTPLEGAGEPLLIASGKGAKLITNDGREIIDAIASWWVNIHGHANQDIAAAIADQAATLEQVIFAGFTHEPALRLAEDLLKLLPSQSKAFFSDDGSTAVEVGLKMAIQYWHNSGQNKTKILALEGAYHGDTFGAMSVGHRGAFTTPFSPYLFDVSFIDLPNKANWEEVKSRFKKELASNEVATFIFEPLVQGAAGMRMYEAEYLDEMISMAKSHGVICIADEIMTGFGRTGRLFASQFLQNHPDIFCLSKGLTGGTLPLSITTCTEEIQAAYRTTDIYKTFFHGHSFTANPITCAAANASLKILLSEVCQQQIQRLVDSHQEQRLRWKGHKSIKAIRQKGTILALELVTPEETSYFNRSRNSIYSFFLDRDILLRPLGNVIYLIPPYVITDAELQVVYKTIDEFLELWPEV